MKKEAVPGKPRPVVSKKVFPGETDKKIPQPRSTRGYGTGGKSPGKDRMSKRVGRKTMLVLI